MPGRQKCCSAVGTDFGVKRWRSLDPCGLTGVSCSWLVHLYALLVIGVRHDLFLTEAPVSAFLYIVFYLPSSILAMSSLYKAWTTDPGAVPMGARPLTIVRNATTTNRQRSIRRCHQCRDNYKPDRAHHDRITGRCIVKFDHYCPWVGNAIGVLNHKYFFLFLIYTAGTCLTSIMILILRVMHCGIFSGNENNKESSINSNSSSKNNGINDVEPGDRRNLLFHMMKQVATASGLVNGDDMCSQFYSSNFVYGLGLASILFLVFTISMACEQIDAIKTGTNKIARLKLRVGQGGTELQPVSHTFNEMFGVKLKSNNNNNNNNNNSSVDDIEQQDELSNTFDWHWLNPFHPVTFPANMHPVVMGYQWDETLEEEPYMEPDEESGTFVNEGDHELVSLKLPTLSLTESDAPAGLTSSGSSSSSIGIRTRRSNQREPVNGSSGSTSNGNSSNTNSGNSVLSLEQSGRTTPQIS